MTQPPHPPTTPPYGTPDTPRLTVRGEAHLDVDPEIARIQITVTARGTDRRTTLQDLTRRNQDTQKLLDTYAQAIHTRETSAFTLTPHLTTKGRHERVRAYHGTIHTTATLTDFTALGELTTRLADQELTRVDGPWWALRPDSPAHRAARRQAVHDAVQRAREYAEALGAHLLALVELADQDVDGYAPFPAARAAAPARMAFAGATTPETAPALDLEPQRQQVYAQVNARFTMTPPQL
ncbi:SIMPL domain-containing protein [Streptomyces sp. SAJ15]|uniref:SIMPL domain-containing protein n=1 Tax=Streptomyces sp. SAJ15 TaxID=2011095 RepID=UPI0011854043|nr:SIMPL domain-containing protein [Streptomyces sp. SAJ15]TVL90830.1 hypothetical protein CD790_19860 [Streptomyces sp. SAJ15]